MADVAHATLVVNLEQSTTWVTADAGTTGWTATTGDYDGGGTANDTRTTWAFSTTTPFSPTGGSYTSALQSARFYGGGSITSYNTSHTSATVVRNAQLNSTLDVVSFGAASSANTATMALVWKKEDFLGSGNLAGNQVNLTGNTALSFSAFTPSASGTAGFYYQWLVQIGTTFYVSETRTLMSQTQTANTPYVSSDLTTTKWAVIDLSTDILSSVGAYAALDLTDIQAVGVYFTSTGQSANKRLFLGGFSADATITAVPEPSSFAILAGGVVLGLAVLRRRR